MTKKVEIPLPPHPLVASVAANLAPNPLVVPIAEGAALLHRHPSWLYRKIYDGEVRICKHFGRLMVPIAELEKFVGELTNYTPQKPLAGGLRRGRKKKEALAP
jgi:hypothetical protein